MTKTYSVEDVRLGEKDKGDVILFKSISDMEEARKELDNGRDIKVLQDGIVTIIPHRMVTNKLYDGTIKLSAIGGESVK